MWEVCWHRWGCARASNCLMFATVYRILPHNPDQPDESAKHLHYMTNILWCWHMQDTHTCNMHIVLPSHTMRTFPLHLSVKLTCSLPPAVSWEWSTVLFQGRRWWRYTCSRQRCSRYTGNSGCAGSTDLCTLDRAEGLRMPCRQHIAPTSWSKKEANTCTWYGTQPHTDITLVLVLDWIRRLLLLRKGTYCLRS